MRQGSEQGLTLRDELSLKKQTRRIILKKTSSHHQINMYTLKMQFTFPFSVNNPKLNKKIIIEKKAFVHNVTLLLYFSCKGEKQEVGDGGIEAEWGTNLFQHFLSHFHFFAIFVGFQRKEARNSHFCCLFFIFAPSARTEEAQDFLLFFN